MKKTKRLFGLFFMVFTLLTGSLSVFADSDVVTQYGITEDMIYQFVESWINELEALTEEEIEQNRDSDEAVATWAEASEGAGAFVEILEDNASYEATDEGFIAEIPVKMENKELLVTLDFSALTGGVAITFSAEGAGSMSLGTIFKKAGINTIIGMGTVFVMLIFISILIWLLGFVPKLLGGKKEEKTAAPAAAAPLPVPVAEPITAGETAGTDDKELVAVIAAAIAAAAGTSTDSFVVRSIRKVKRS